VGKCVYTQMLTEAGGIKADVTVLRLGDQSFRVVDAGFAGRSDMKWMTDHLPADGSVTLRNITGSRGVFVLAGPRARDVMAKLTDVPLDNASFPWLTGQVIEAGLATDVYALRVNFVGALGWELHFPIEYAHGLFDAIFAAGADYGIGMAGMRAMESLRMEKSYRMWGSDLTRENTPLEAGLARFVRMEKGHFEGRDALEKQTRNGIPLNFVTLEVHDVTDADPLGNEPIFTADGTLVGRATSGYYGHCLRKSLAIGYVKPEFAAVGTELAVEVLGERKRATVLVDSPYDPQNTDLRA
jgi:dimethylglycine dehydrogenase